MENDSAIVVLKESLKAVTLKKELYAKQLIYENLSTCYQAIEKKDSVVLFNEKEADVKKVINAYVNGLLVENKEYKNQVVNKKEENKVLNTTNKMLFIGLIILLLVTCFIFYNWYVSKKKKKDLEVKHEQVIEEIKTIKK